MQYRIESDGWGDLTLWRYDSPHDLEPAAVATKHAIQDNDEQWMLMVRGAGLDPRTVCVSREDLLAMVEAVDSDTATGEQFDATARIEQTLGTEVHTLSHYPARTGAQR